MKTALDATIDFLLLAVAWPLIIFGYMLLVCSDLIGWLADRTASAGMAIEDIAFDRAR